MIYSPFATVESEVYGKLTPPNDITSFFMVSQGDQAHLSWEAVSDLDVINGGTYWIRYTSKTSGASWQASTDITKNIPGNATSYSVPLMTGTYLIKALDSSGNESQNAAMVTSNVADILELNVVYTSTQSPDFGDSTTDKGVNDPDTSNIYYDMTNQVIQLDTAVVGTGTHDPYYKTGTHTDSVGANGSHDAVLNAGGTVYLSNNVFDSSTGLFDDRTGSFDDILHTAFKLEDENASFDSSWLNKVVRNTTDNTTATVTAVDSSTVLTLDTDIFDGTPESYRLETVAYKLRDLSANFTSTLLGRVVRNVTDDTTAIVTAIDSTTKITLDADIFANGHSDVYEIEWGPDRLYSHGIGFTTEHVGKVVWNTTQNTSTTIAEYICGCEVRLTDPIFENRDGDGFRVDVPDYYLRDTTASFGSTAENRLIRNLDTGELTSAVTVLDSNNILLVDNIFDQTDQANYKIEGDVLSTGYYYFTDQEYDLGEVYTNRITAKYACNSFTTTSLFDGTSGLFDEASGLFDGTDISDTNASLEISTTSGDPAGSPTWSPWTPFFIGDYIARAVRFRLKLTSGNTTHNIAVSELAATIDMPDTIKRAHNITTSSGTSNGTEVVVYDTPFKTTPTVGITAIDANDKEYYVITNSSATGFTITFYDNNTSQATQKTFNWLSSGY